MDHVSHHQETPDVTFDGGPLDCGNGLLLLIRRHIDPLPSGGVLEVRSTEPTVADDLPAWCRMTQNKLLSVVQVSGTWSFLVRKGGSAAETADVAVQPIPKSQPARANESSLPEPILAPPLPPLAVMGIGSWPRPRWMLEAIHCHISGQLADDAFHDTADDAVRLCVQAQQRAGVDVITDGEQRRDSYASFVGGLLDNCQLIPITDLLPYVDDPAKFESELRALDVPAGEVRHPAVFGKLGRSRPLAVHELEFTRGLTGGPIKVALPGPYLLTRTMWLECVSDRAYDSREALADDIVAVLRAELFHLLAAGATVVQFDEPVLTEVVFGTPQGGRSFMCGALSEKRSQEEELAFASSLVNRVVDGAPRERTAIHICRGNWSRNEAVALAGDYRPLVSLLGELQVGGYFLEACTPRAGELEVLTSLPADRRIGIGVVNQKLDAVESVADIRQRISQAVELFGADRLVLTPDCGFATFADNPIASARTAEAKLAAIVAARNYFR
ncbi:MAG: sulfurtransferase TusA family protein [Planctomycetaceae bacterium]|nr:sulfurtransferase TusA family protein [Planctomycetales bacterium]MCB9925020.1 sulfurtransferase TusA family protein [Planctomycetaceae bacterium]